MGESAAIWSLQGEGEREWETAPALLHVCAHGSSAGIGSLCCAGGARLLAHSADCCLFQRTVLCACTYFKASDAWQLFYSVAMRWVCGQAHGFAHVGVLAAVLCSLCVPALVVVATGDCWMIAQSDPSLREATEHNAQCRDVDRYLPMILPCDSRAHRESVNLSVMHIAEI